MQNRRPDFVELNAIGSILHSYYCGIGSIFNLIYKSTYGKTLSGNAWHSELFTDMFAKTEKHEPVLPQELFQPLKEYLGFRHVFRHSYGYELDWQRLKPLSSVPRTRKCHLGRIFSKVEFNTQIVKAVKIPLSLFVFKNFFSIISIFLSSYLFPSLEYK